MSAQDALWLTMDRPNNLMVVDSALVLAEVPELEAVRAVFATAVDRFPVLGRRAVRQGLGWAWQDDAGFDLAGHVRVSVLGEGHDMAALQRFVGEQRAVALDRARPLWEAFLVHPLRLDDGSAGAAVVARFHHAMADGIRLTQVMLSLLADHGDALPDAAGPPAEAAPHGVARVLGPAVGAAVNATVGATVGLARAGVRGVELGLDLVRRPGRWVDAVESLGAGDHRVANDVAAVSTLAFGGSPRAVWTGRPGTAKAMAWSQPVPLEGLKAVGRAHGATVNDVVLTGMAAGLRRYLSAHGSEADEVLWMVPVNLVPFADNLPAELGNHFALVWLPMPLGSPDQPTTLQQMRAQMDRIKHSDEAMLTFGLQRLVSLTPRQVAFFVTNFFANKAVGVLTNVPGPQVPMTFAGAPVTQVIGFAPCSGDNPMTATIFSYNGAVTIGFGTDAGLVPDPGLLVDLVVDELSAMQVR